MQLQGGLCLSSYEHARLAVQGSSSSRLLSRPASFAGVAGSTLWPGEHQGQKHGADILTHLRKVTVESQAVSWMRPMHRVL